MNSKFRQIPARLEHAVEWRIKRFRKIIRATRQVSVPAAAKETEFRTLWGDAWYNELVQENKVFYESFSGNNALCNPSAIFMRLLERPDFASYEHVWALASQQLKDEFDAAHKHHPNVTSVIYESATYYRELSRTKYLINNATFQPAFTKRRNQIYINTWHGTPLKKMGYDVPGGGQGSYNILRNFASADYILSPNKFTTDTMLRQAFRLQGVYEGKVIEEGYPRIDAQFKSIDSKISTRRLLASHGLHLDDDKSTVIYAPTWKGNSFHSPQDESSQLLQRIKQLEEQVGDKYQFFIKVHQRVYNYASLIPELSNRLIPNSLATNEALAIADVLVTDYSSIFFDFLSTNKPVLFHVPDHREYDTVRGFYIDIANLPGPTSLTIGELADQLGSLGSGSASDPVLTHREAYRAARGKYCPYDDGGATDRVIEIAFNGQTDGYNIIDLSPCDKIKVLIFLGGMKSNGITSAAINLVANINYDKFDVSIMIPQATKHSDQNIYARIDPRARQFLRSNTFPATDAHLAANIEFLAEETTSSSELPPLIKQLLNAEWHRLLGDSRFDHIIDFSGYAGFWSYILRQGPAKTHSVWLHSNLKADAERMVNGKFINRKSLYSQFRAYTYYDKLISVSEALSEINAKNLSEYAPVSKFKHVSNTLNLERLEISSNNVKKETFIGTRPDMAGLTLDETLQSLSLQFSWDDISKSASKAQRYADIFPDDENVITFITVGRLSPEKNHERLINAFAIVYESFPESRLIIAGDGPKRAQLVQLVYDLQLSQSVRFLGHVDDGLEIMAKSSCFVLSSDYEGQPMVILEARSVGLPVITVEFGAVASVLAPDEGLIVPMSVEGLSQGMTQFIRDGSIPSKEFDPRAFNREAMHGFERAILD